MSDTELNLVSTWLAAAKANGSKSNTESLDDLNRATGLNIQNNRMYEWRAGTKRPSDRVVNYMLSESLLYVIQQTRPNFKFKSSEQFLMIAKLSLPVKEN